METISYIGEMKETYYIYHIKGVKIGVSNNPNRRVKNQGYDSFEILETHKDVIKVSEREIELQKQYGYKVDTIPYHIFVNGKNQQAGGKIVGRKNGIMVTSRPEWSKTASMGGKIGGKIRAATMTFEERSSAGKKNRKYSQDEIKWIRQQYATGNYTMKQIRTIFGMAHSACSNIINYKTYKEL
jgi:hypothetical protein